MKYATSSGNRRMSERDLTRMGADGKNVGGPLIANNHLANSKSVPALHHHMGSGTISMANSKSRSTHSLANPATNLNNTLNNNANNNNNNEQGFYQNLSVYRNQNQSQPILSERPPMPSHSAMNAYNGNSQQNTQNPILSPTNGTGPTGNQHQNPYQQQQQQQPPQQHQNSQHPMITSPHSSNMLPSRPQSAYYQQQQQPPQHQHLTQQQQFAQHAHNFSASTTNLSTIQHQTQQQQQHSQHPMHHMTPQQQQLYREQQQQQSMTLGNRSKSTQNFQRDMQTQQSLRMQQMMAPSMPNISNMYQQQHQQQQQQQSHPGNHSNMSMAASQSMQNVSSMGGDTLEQNNGGYMSQAQHSPAGGAQTLRRNMRPDYMDGGAQHSPNMTQMQQQQQGNFMTLPPKPGQQQQQLTPPKQQQPPTAPKPQQNRLSGTQQQFPPQSYLGQTLYSQQQQQQQQQPQTAEEKPPLPPTTTHPLYKATQQITPGMNYIASTLDPPKGGYVPVSASALQQNKNMLGTNPWEREEREKEVEMRREHIRQWREQQINELSSIAQHLIMSQQKQRSSSIGLLKTATINSADMQKKSSAASILLNNNNNNIQNNLISSQQSSPSSSTMDMYSATSSSSPSSILMRDNKRVSFHDEENNYVVGGSGSTAAYHQMEYNSNSVDMSTVSSNGASGDLNTIREDSSFLPQNVDTSMLPSMPATPDAAAWNTTVQSTPGVIGAQEVYRDPRTRRLAEKQQQQQQRNTEAVPEKLSFKEKMKMFALESGEDNTPKDKLKISRAQRDIDAVH
ncbi:transcription factor mef2A-like [Musca vetustissima]|uniref:transcription factor mef2A-like n=1 Tax=Musca vetustissima TaxID=27455 RepID=UPI002AB701A1|nr:transcription factor mef2A-like [Musca vetustissima]